MLGLRYKNLILTKTFCQEIQTWKIADQTFVAHVRNIILKIFNLNLNEVYFGSKNLNFSDELHTVFILDVDKDELLIF